MMAASSPGMGVGRTASPFSKGGNSHTVTPPNNQSAQMQ